MSTDTIYTPATLSKRWFCSERHIRNLIKRGHLGHFHLGGKLLRIKDSDVYAYECNNAVLPEANTVLREDPTKENVKASAPPSALTRAKIAALRSGAKA